MTEAQRHSSILELLKAEQYLSVAKLIEVFDISPATARRDINKLNDLGKLHKVRNGAEEIKREKSAWIPLNIHNVLNLDEKVKIAKAAAALCKAGDTAVINCGSTAFNLGQEICNRDIQVITNYFPLARYLIEEDHDQVVIIGGQYNKSQSITLAPQDDVSSLYAGHWMFTSGKGINEDGLYKTDMLTAMTETKMIDHVGKIVVLADSTKVGTKAGMLFCTAKQMDILITGKKACPMVIDKLRENNVEVILV